MESKKKVLAIDDENDVLLIIRSALHAEGYEVVTANNGYDGLALAEDASPDLIILDIMMPEMDGFEVLEQLKENERTAHIPIVILTGVSSKDKIREALNKGIDYYIVKPFDYQDLVSKVKLAIADAEGSAS
jgi:two-component system sensor histidine kinase/response regulator